MSIYVYPKTHTYILYVYTCICTYIYIHMYTNCIDSLFLSRPQPPPLRAAQPASSMGPSAVRPPLRAPHHMCLCPGSVSEHVIDIGSS